MLLISASVDIKKARIHNTFYNFDNYTTEFCHLTTRNSPHAVEVCYVAISDLFWLLPGDPRTKTDLKLCSSVLV